MVRAATLALALVLATSAQAASREEQLAAQLRRTPIEIEPLIKVSGDDMDPTITVSTYGVTALTSKGLLASSTYEDSFLRAFIKKSDGSVLAQIYHVAQYSGSGWKYFNRATYETPDGLKEADTDRIDSDVHCYQYGCSYSEDVGIVIDYSVLQAGATKFDPSNPANGIHYRLFAKSGDQIDEAIPGNEIAAFVAVVDRERAKLGH